MNRFAALLGERIRRDGVQLILWTCGTALLAAAAAPGALQSYGSEQDRIELLATVMANPVILLFRGLPSGAGAATFVTFLIFPWLAILAAFMSTFLAVRHTRAEEEDGRMELISATPAGRGLPMLATVTHGVMANALIAVLVTAAFLANGFPTEGSWLAGCATGAVGLVFLAIGLLSAQLVRTSRAANSVSVTALLLTFVLAGIGNALGTPSDDLQRRESSWLTWLSPFGWGENTRAYADDDWRYIALCAVAFVAVAVLALALQSVRDLGAGLVPERQGRANARAALRSSSALVWRLTYGSVIGWAIGGFLTGALSTSLGGVVDRVDAENPAVQQVLETLAGTGSPAAGVVVIFFTMVGIFCACCAVQTVVRARQEESRGSAEIVLALPMNRVRWLADFIVVGFAAVVIIAAAAVAGAALGATDADGAPDLVRDAVVAAAGQVAAASVFLGSTALVFVLAPRWTIAAGWTLIGLAAVVGLFGPLFDMPDWAVHLSPFDIAPVPVGADVDLRGLGWLVLAVGVGVAASLVLMRRRELATGG